MTEKINEITYIINGAVFEVNKVLGAGFLEKVYEKALLVEFHKRGLKAEAQVPITVKYKGQVVGEYFADIVVEEQVILEGKNPTPEGPALETPGRGYNALTPEGARLSCP